MRAVRERCPVFFNPRLSLTALAAPQKGQVLRSRT
jgi:hypothetical protein